MSEKVQALLRELFDTDPSQYAQTGHKVEQTGSGYKLFVSDKMGAFGDIIQAHKALEHVGLVDSSRKPQVGDYGITTTEGHTTLGFGDGKGGFYDKVTLSDNASALAAVGKGFSFEVNFGNRSEADITQKLSAAIEFAAANRDKGLLEEAARERAKAANAKRDNQYEAIAAGIQKDAGRDDVQDEKVVADYIRKQLEREVPGVKVEISKPKDAEAIEYVYGVKTQDRDITVTLPPKEAQRFRDMPWDGPDGSSAYMGKLSDALREKLTVTRRDFVGIDGVRGSILSGSVAGSSARLAAELNGELQAHIAPQQVPDGKGQNGDAAARTNPGQDQKKAKG